MGMESYLLRLRGRQSDLKTVIKYAESTLGLAPDLEQFVRSAAYSYYVFRDKTHMVEAEFFQAPAHYEISLRFALCHPFSIRPVFLNLAQSLISQFSLTATICEDVPEGEPREYAADDNRFAANCLWSMARAQERWREQFGPVEVGLSVSEALRRFFFNDTGETEQARIDRRAIPTISPFPARSTCQESSQEVHG